MVYSQDMQKGSTFDEISGIFPDSTMSLLRGRCAVWKNTTDPITGVSFVYIMAISYTWSILLGPYF